MTRFRLALQRRPSSVFQRAVIISAAEHGPSYTDLNRLGLLAGKKFFPRPPEAFPDGPAPISAYRATF
jgi:hypothetical protein